MNRLRIPLTNVPEQGMAFDERIPVRDIQPPDAETLPVESVTLQGTLMPISGDYLFQGRVSGTFAHPCDRCLQLAEMAFEVPVTWTFHEGNGTEAPLAEEDEEEVFFDEAEETGEVHTISGDELDLAPSVWEELALAMPSKYVCQEDCKGLCSHCGANLNETTCTCEGSEAETGEGNAAFSKLRDLFPDLPK